MDCHKIKQNIRQATDIPQVVKVLEELDNKYLKGKWNNSAVTAAAAKAGDNEAVAVYCLAEYRIRVINYFNLCRNWQQAEMMTMQQIIQNINPRNSGVHFEF